MTQIRKIGLALALLLSSTSMAAAQCASQCCELCGKKVCHLEVSKEKESVTCFDVKAKDICIPGIKLPWECKRRCGGVRTICVLNTVKGEKTVCKYDWSVKAICTTCCKKHGLKCGTKSCDVCSDKRVPFDYYAVQQEPTQPSQDTAAVTVRPVSAQLPLQPPVKGAAGEVTFKAAEKAKPGLSPLAKFRKTSLSFWDALKQ